MKAIAYTTAARRAFRKLPADVQARVKKGLRRYAETGDGDVKIMTGVAGCRLRVGDYRVIFSETAEHIEVRAVAHRRDVYR